MKPQGMSQKPHEHLPVSERWNPAVSARAKCHRLARKGAQLAAMERNGSLEEATLSEPAVLLAS